MQLVDAGADERQERRQQGDRGHDGDGDRGGGAPRETREEAQAHQQQTEQRDHDGDAGEDDRAARGTHGLVDRVHDAGPACERRAVAGHDQERVVDADADADHRRDLTGEVGCVDERGPEGDGGERHEDARDRGDDRKSHRDDGAEREQQDHHGGEETEELGRRHLAVGEGVAAERHVDRGAVGDLLHRERGDAQVLCRILVVGCEVDRRERDVPIGGEAGRVVERRVDVRHTREDGDVAHDGPDGCLVRGRAEIGVGPEDHDG